MRLEGLLVAGGFSEVCLQCLLLTVLNLALLGGDLLLPALLRRFLLLDIIFYVHSLCAARLNFSRTIIISLLFIALLLNRTQSIFPLSASFDDGIR